MFVFRILALSLSILILTISFTRAELRVAKLELDDGTPYIFISGTFEFDNNPSELQRLISIHSPSFVTFNSPGGNILAAMNFGRTIRRNNISTFQLRKLECSSACALTFMGGLNRTAETGSIGLHQSSFSDDTQISSRDAVAASQRITAKIITYMVEMGVDPSILELGLNYAASDMRYLSNSEMSKYRVINNTRKPRRQPPPPQASNNSPQKPKWTGLTRHPSGEITMRIAANRKSNMIQKFRNGLPAEIFGETNRWYLTKIGKKIGYIHSTSIKIDQFYDGGFYKKHIQIKSFQTKGELLEFARSSNRSLSGFLATNGWYALTLRGTFEDEQATTTLEYLKKSNRIPDDSFKTYGNTYVKKVCCN